MIPLTIFIGCLIVIILTLVFLLGYWIGFYRARKRSEDIVCKDMDLFKK